MKHSTQSLGVFYDPPECDERCDIEGCHFTHIGKWFVTNEEGRVLATADTKEDAERKRSEFICEEPGQWPALN